MFHFEVDPGTQPAARDLFSLILAGQESRDAQKSEVFASADAFSGDGTVQGEARTRPQPSPVPCKRPALVVSGVSFTHHNAIVLSRQSRATESGYAQRDSSQYSAD
jgi:hypothetical protein